MRQSKPEANRAVDAARAIAVASGALEDIETLAGIVVSKLAVTFDSFGRDANCQSEGESQGNNATVRSEVMADIPDAHRQVKHLTHAQRDSIGDVAVEIVPDEILRPKNTPVRSVCRGAPCREFSIMACAPMSVVTIRRQGKPAKKYRPSA
ncbi:hypothetical protein [Maritimibacter fusiformis]|uniref:hypothetical protein n=1 Tax=Maritimibacter fusiformis TaxID=2603819 RepID=UPI0011DDCEAC|nr:hypothetical protein [Maritimibacter fusiformis]